MTNHDTNEPAIGSPKKPGDGSKKETRPILTQLRDGATLLHLAGKALSGTANALGFESATEMAAALLDVFI